MKQTIETLLLHALNTLKTHSVLAEDLHPTLIIERCRDSQHGDFASNLALLLAKPTKTPPRVLAQTIIAALPAHEAIVKVELAGAGFINFFVNPDFRSTIKKTFRCAAGGIHVNSWRGHRARYEQ